MPTQNKIITGGNSVNSTWKPDNNDWKVINDDWALVADTNTEGSSQAIPEGKVIVPLALWQSQPELQNRNDVGVWLSNDSDLTQVAEELLGLPLIAIDFPIFMDGRGFSLARLLRERYGYQGEMRAIGNIIRDQLCYLKRCGFNAFRLDESVDLNASLASLNDFTEVYQTSVDMPEPLFRRKVV